MMILFLRIVAFFVNTRKANETLRRALRKRDKSQRRAKRHTEQRRAIVARYK